jgi:hypothetical protein
MKSILSFFILITTSLSWALPTIDPNKRTVCAMTINSDEEREVFREQIAKDTAHYNQLVELTEFGDKDWLQQACKSGIRCDQLVISAHFTDVFGGTSDVDNVRRSVKLDDLERMGCQNTCEGILDHPYEVFLLGCNTLATKAPDTRTPDEYLNHLIEEKVSRPRAELITEARYGRTGDDNRSRVERVFRGQQKMLYGFTGRGPSGATIEDMLRDYFKKVPLRRSLTRVEAMRSMGHIEAMNSVLAESLNMTLFDQCAAGEDGERDRKICSIRNSKLSVDRRLAIMEDALTDEDWIKYIPTFNNFFRQNPVDKMTPAQKALLAQMARNDVIGRQARNLAVNSKYQAVRAEWEYFNRSIGFTRPLEPIAPRKADPIGDIIDGLDKKKPSHRLDHILDGIR